MRFDAASERYVMSWKAKCVGAARDMLDFELTTDAEPEPGVPLELRADKLLNAGFKESPLDIFAASGPEAEDLKQAKEAADLLVRLKLARYADEGRTEIQLTNAGRYWALHGGYLAFLKEDPPQSGGGARQRNPELESRLRLNTFWWTFGLAIASFVISIISVAIALFYGERIFR